MMCSGHDDDDDDNDDDDDDDDAIQALECETFATFQHQ